MKTVFALYLAVALLPSPSLPRKGVVADGYYWDSLSPDEKLAFSVGFMNGNLFTLAAIIQDEVLPIQELRSFAIRNVDGFTFMEKVDEHYALKIAPSATVGSIVMLYGRTR